MAKRGRPASPAVACSMPEHTGAVVRRFGKRVVNGEEHQRFQCTPLTGKAHFFHLPLGLAIADRRVPYLPPETCKIHPGSKLIRYGTYKRRNSQRQRYLCTPSNDDKPHSFTPLLPREHVDEGDACELCAEVRGLHRGKTASARGHMANTRTVAEGLQRLARGESYSSVSTWARKELKGNEDASAKATWRLAADWCEVFSPVLWEPYERIAKARIDRVVDAGNPTVVLIDDVPLFATPEGEQRSKQRFAVLGAAEVFFDANGVRKTKMRLLRAFPNHDEDAYKLLLDELGYLPDFIVADGAPAIRNAVDWLGARDPAKDIVYVISEFHVHEQLDRAIRSVTDKCQRFTPGHLLDQLNDMSLLRSEADWLRWNDDLTRRMDAQGVPHHARPNWWRRELKPYVDRQVKVLDQYPEIPRSTGKLETLLAHEIMPSLSRRAIGFGNLARTNQLLDLMVLRLNDRMNSAGQIAQLLRTDARAHEGYAPPVRSIVDRGMYRSLLDKNTTSQLVANLGL